ncbi:MAG: response regulator transcription factor [Bacteroidia bacterium]
MKYSYLLFGLIMGLLLLLLQTLQYRVMLRDLSLELYGGIIAIIFAGIGILLGSGIFRKKHEKNSPASVAHPDRAKIAASQLSSRELQVLELMARGYTNQEIATQLFVSRNTIKTHTSNIYSKLEVKRRTQAVQRAQEMNLITSPVGVK